MKSDEKAPRTQLPDEKRAGPERRTFLNWFLGSSLAALGSSIFYPIARFMSPPRVPEATTNQVEAGPTNDPDFVNKGFKIVRFGSEPIIVIRFSETEYRAFTATCTHLECIVEFRKKDRDIWCNCHNGKYDLQGRNIAGPPPRPLTPFSVHVVAKGPGESGTVIVSRT